VFDTDGETVSSPDDFDLGRVTRDFSGAEVLFHTVFGETLGVSPTEGRLRDPNDRRRILVAPCKGVDTKLAWGFEPLRQAVNELVDNEFHNGEREVIRRYLIRITELLREHAGKLRSMRE